MSLGARLFVAAVFTLLGVSFIATTAALYMEFGHLHWFSIAAFYSHLFIFFPTAGLLALAAFYVPAAVFVDLYWRHVRFGQLRFVLGTLILMAASWGVAHVILSGEVPAMWELRPDTLAADEGNPRRCAGERGAAPREKAALAHNQCKRVPLLDALLAVRDVSQKRTGLSPFVRDCTPDPYAVPSPEQTSERFCFPSKSFQTKAECCASLLVLSADLVGMYRGEQGEHSFTGHLHRLLLPLKVFFLFVLLAIGFLLAAWRREVDHHYPGHAQRIERGVLVGAATMLLWPIMNHAFIQAATLIYGGYAGSAYAKISPVISLAFGLWALLLVLFFFRQHERDLEAAGKIFGGVASIVAVMKYNQIVDYSVRFVGSGADRWEVAVLCGICIAAFGALLWTASRPEAQVPRVSSPEQSSVADILTEERGGPT